MARQRGRRRRSLRKNPLSTKQKALGVGGVLVLGAGAYALLRSGPSAPPPPPPGSEAAAVAGALASQCAALQTSLFQLRASLNPDRTAMTRLEAQIASCITEARAAGGEIDNSMANLSTGDAAFQRIEGWINEYKETQYSDALKRNNIRQEMLRAGEAMARAYSDAVAASPNAATTRAIRQSILRALDAAVVRRLCYLYDQPGCGRFGVNEDHGNDKARQERERVIDPLMAAQAAALSKLWSQNGIWQPEEAGYFATLLKPAIAANDYIAVKFAEYKTVDYSDALRRNTIRQEMLAAGREMTAALQLAGNEAISHRDLGGQRAVAGFLTTSLTAAVNRWVCFITDQPGCGRFGVNEDHGNDKAAQEWATTLGPLFDLWARVAQALVWNGDVTAYEPLVLLKVSRCRMIGDFVNAKFAEYKSVDWSDAVRRNSLRQVVLQFGGILAAAVRDAMITAVTGAAARPGALMARAIAAIASGPSTGMMLNIMPTVQPATSGLGQLLAMPLTVIAPTAAVTKSTTTAPTGADALVQGAVNAGIKNVRAVMLIAKTALDAAITRQLCFLYDQPGCGRFGANEDDNATKAQQEYTTTVAPLMASVQQGTTFLIGTGDPNAETALISSKLRYCTALVDYINAKHAEYQTVEWSDAVRRNNLRVGQVRDRARNELLPCLRSTGPVTATGRSMVKAVVDSALAASRSRAACYGDSSSRCGRFGNNEDDNATKVAQETSMITTPLAEMSSRLAAGQSLAGLGDAPMTPGAWLGVAIVGGAIVYGAVSASQKPVRQLRPMYRNSKRRSSKRTSRAA